MASLTPDPCKNVCKVRAKDEDCEVAPELVENIRVPDLNGLQYQKF